ncbi:MAG: hypothetical protein LBT00_05665 [Spirochaetaceae bacterium]|nr:hypothetical protein [Spirochaetaceae bacterium]
MNDVVIPGWSASPVIARRRRATFGSQCRRRSNPERAFPLDCFAPLAMTPAVGEAGSR